MAPLPTREAVPGPLFQYRGLGCMLGLTAGDVEVTWLQLSRRFQVLSQRIQALSQQLLSLHQDEQGLRSCLVVILS